MTKNPPPKIIRMDTPTTYEAEQVALYKIKIHPEIFTLFNSRFSNLIANSKKYANATRQAKKDLFYSCWFQWANKILDVINSRHESMGLIESTEQNSKIVLDPEDVFSLINDPFVSGKLISLANEIILHLETFAFRYYRLDFDGGDSLAIKTKLYYVNAENV